MAKDFSIHVATIGAGLFNSTDGGENWGRAQGIWADTRVYSLEVNPKNPNTMYAGTDEGIFRSNDNGKTYRHLDSPMDSTSVWKIAVDPSNPEIVFAGTSPSAVYRSQDGGATWEELRRAGAVRGSDLHTFDARLYIAGERGVLQWDEASRHWLDG